LSFLLTALLLGSGPAPLKLKLTTSLKAAYRVTTDQATYGASNPKPTEQVVNVMPFAFQVTSGGGNSAGLAITKGPLIVKGRPVGRSKVSVETIDAQGSARGRAPANFFVCLPPGGAKVGQSWKAPFFGGPPLPAGMQASYKYSSSASGLAVVDMTVDYAGAGKLHGTGKLFLRLSDGFLDHGSANFQIAYVQPDHKDPKKISVSSRVVLKYTIAAG